MKGLSLFITMENKTKTRKIGVKDEVKPKIILAKLAFITRNLNYSKAFVRVYSKNEN